MKKNVMQRYSQAKRLTDEEILFLAGEDFEENADEQAAGYKLPEKRTAPTNTGAKGIVSNDDSEKPRRGRPKKNTEAEKSVPTEKNVNKTHRHEDKSETRRPGRPKRSESIVELAKPLEQVRSGDSVKAKFDRPDAVLPPLKKKDIFDENLTAEKRRPGRPKLNEFSPERPDSVLPPLKLNRPLSEYFPLEKNRPNRDQKDESEDISIVSFAKSALTKVPEPIAEATSVSTEKRRPGRPKKNAQTDTKKPLQPIVSKDKKSPDSTGELFTKPNAQSAEAFAKHYEQSDSRRPGRPRKSGFVNIEIPEKEVIAHPNDSEDFVGEEGIQTPASETATKRRPGRPRKDGTVAEDHQESDDGAEVSLAEKVKKLKKRRGRRSKKNPFVVVISKDENKPKPVSEEEKVTASFSIKDAISSTLKKEAEKVEAQPRMIEPLTDVYTITRDKLLSIDEKNNEFITNFIRDVEKFLIDEMYVDRSSKVLVAVSGGVDSIIMLDILALLSDKYKFSIFVAHYNHNLRGEASDKDQEFVRKVAESYNLPFYVAGGKVRQYAEKNSTSIEAAARFLRYSFLERTSRNLNADFVATAHTSDDSAETFLMNLLRGSGLTGLSGIPYRRQFVKDVLLIRPFINFNKATLIKYAKLRNIKWREDESNALQNYTRNRVRHDLIPKLAKDYNPAIIEVINRTAKLLQGADRIIHGYVRNNLVNVLTDIQTERFTIKLPIFQTFDRFIQGEMIQTALMKYLRVQLPSLKAIDRVVALQDSEIGAKCEVTKTITAVRDRNTIVFSKKQFLKEVNTIIDKVGKFKVGNVIIVLKEVGRKQMEFNKNPNVEFFDFDAVPPAISLRTWEDGDVFTPLGMNGTMKISDFLTNEKVAFVDRQNVLVLATKTEVFWVLGKRISERFKVRPDSDRVLKVEIRYSEK